MLASRSWAYSFAVTPSTPAAAFFLICPTASRRNASSIKCASVVHCISGFRAACSAILSSFVDTVADLNVSSVFPCSVRHTRLHFPAIYSGSLGLHHFPTYSVAAFSLRPSVLCSAKTASARLGAVRFRSLPDTLLLPSFVSHHFWRLDVEQVRLGHRQGSWYAGTPHPPAVSCPRRQEALPSS